MTGSGYAFISGTSGTKIHYETQGQLNCAPDGTEKIEVDWTTGSGKNKVKHEFDLYLGLASSNLNVFCVDNGTYPDPVNANFNESIGSGLGSYSLNNVAQTGDAKVTFDLIDGGEPGIGNDRVSIKIEHPVGTVILNVVNQPLTQGNLQTHGNTADGTACEVPPA